MAIIFWAFFVLSGVVIFLLNPKILTGEGLKEFIEGHGDQLKWYYASICLIRCITLIPVTPFVVAGVLLFPDDLHFVMIVSLVTVLMAASIHYYFSVALGFSDYFNEKYSKSMDKFRRGMKKYGFLYIYLWTITPFLPSDPIYYVAGISRMKFSRFITAVFFGGCMLLGVYVYFGKNFFEWILGI